MEYVSIGGGEDRRRGISAENDLRRARTTSVRAERARVGVLPGSRLAGCESPTAVSRPPFTHRSR